MQQCLSKYAGTSGTKTLTSECAPTVIDEPVDVNEQLCSGLTVAELQRAHELLHSHDPAPYDLIIANSYNAEDGLQYIYNAERSHQMNSAYTGQHRIMHVE